MGGNQSSGRQSFLDKTAAYIDDNGVLVPNGPAVQRALKELEAFEQEGTKELLFLKKHPLEITDQYVYHWRHVDNGDALESITSAAEDVSIKKQTFKDGDVRYLVSFPSDEVETFTYREHDSDSSSDSDSDSESSDSEDDIFEIRKTRREHFGKYHPAAVRGSASPAVRKTSAEEEEAVKKSPLEGLATGGMSRLQRLHAVAQGLTPE